MKIRELMEDSFVTEMANFLADLTELPANIVLWTRPQPEELPHTKYRIKIFKDRIHCATYSIGEAPAILWQHSKKRLRLDDYEANEVAKVIGRYSSLFIQYVDERLTAPELKTEIAKRNG